MGFLGCVRSTSHPVLAGVPSTNALHTTAPTDSGKGDKIPEEGGVANLLKFVELFQGVEKRRQHEEKYLSDGVRYGDLKNELAEAIFAELKPIQEKRKIYENDPSLVDEVLNEGAKKARKIAEETVKEVKEKMGLLYI